MQSFVVKDYLGHTWAEELIPFDFSAATTASHLTLADAAGQPVPCQFTDLQRAGGQVTGQVGTVVTLPPHGSASFQLLPGRQGVDLDVHVLSPAGPRLDQDHWSFDNQIYVWGQFQEEQWALRVSKQGNPVSPAPARGAGRAQSRARKRRRMGDSDRQGG